VDGCLHVRIPRVLPPGIVERGEVDGLCMRGQVATYGIGQVVVGQVLAWRLRYDRDFQNTNRWLEKV
jgi:hypothetical protein